LRFTKFAVLITAVLCFTVVVVSTALASPYHAYQSIWYTGSTQLAVGKSFSKPLSWKVGEQGGSSKIRFTWVISGTPIELAATGFNCVNCDIENVKSPTLGESAVMNGELELTGLSVVRPNGCTVTGVSRTKPVVGIVGREEGSYTKNVVKFEPAAGPVGTFMTIQIGTCGLAGSYKISGTIYAEMLNLQGISSETQPMLFSQAIQEQFAGSAYALKMGESPAYFAGRVNTSLQAGGSFSTKES
jgi:hypothetical protein